MASRSRSSLVAGCLSLLATFAVLAVVNYRLLARLDESVRLGVALVSALLLGLGLHGLFQLATGYGRGDVSLEAMVRRARSGEPPADGQPMIATGTVRALGAPLEAPLSGVPCVFCLYRMYYVTPGPRSSHEVPVYWGYVARPFAIDSAISRFRVLAVPLVERSAEERRGADAVERARRLVAATAFEPKAHLLGAIGSALSMVHDVFTDDDGEARRDWKAEGNERDPADLRLEETVLPVGAEASAHGTWSAERGGIVTTGAAGSTVTVVLGPPEKLTGVGSAPHSYASYVVTSLVLTALGAGLLWFGVRILPKLR
jgi:hypothetical protein